MRWNRFWFSAIGSSLIPGPLVWTRDAASSKPSGRALRGASSWRPRTISSKIAVKQTRPGQQPPCIDPSLNVAYVCGVLLRWNRFEWEARRMQSLGRARRYLLKQNRTRGASVARKCWRTVESEKVLRSDKYRQLNLLRRYWPFLRGFV